MLHLHLLEVSWCNSTAKADEHHCWQNPSGLAVKSRASFHCTVQGSLPPISALSSRQVSTLPPKPVMQESTLFSGSIEKKHQHFESKYQSPLSEQHGLQTTRWGLACDMQPGHRLLGQHPLFPHFFVIAMGMIVLNSEILKGLRWVTTGKTLSK